VISARVGDEGKKCRCRPLSW